MKCDNCNLEMSPERVHLDSRECRIAIAAALGVLNELRERERESEARVEAIWKKLESRIDEIWRRP